MIIIEDYVKKYMRELKQAVDSVPLDRLEELVDALLKAYDRGKSVFIMGNGGSATTASHFTCDINKGVCFGLQKRMKVICLNDNVPTVLAYANDASYDDIFVEQLRNFLSPGDLVVGISGSGNSSNVIKAIKFANDNGAISSSLTGFAGGVLAGISKIPVVIPVNDMQKAEDVHLILVHIIMQILYKKLRGNGVVLMQELLHDGTAAKGKRVHLAKI